MIERLVASLVPRLGKASGLELAARQGVDGIHAGRHRSRRIGSSLDFADHRAYQQGDDPRDIDWKAYARSDRLLVRRWHDDRQLPVALLVDTSASMAYRTPPEGDQARPTKGYHARLVAAILGLLALDQGDRVQLLLSGNIGGEVGGHDRFSRPNSPDSLCAMLSALGDGGQDAATDLVRTATERLGQRHLLILISDLLDDPGELIEIAGVAGARGHELAALQVLDASELELPTAWGSTRLVDPEERHASVEGDAADLAAGYAEAFATHQSRLLSGLAGVGAEHHLLPTHGEAAAQVAAWLGRRSFR